MHSSGVSNEYLLVLQLRVVTDCTLFRPCFRVLWLPSVHRLDLVLSLSKLNRSLACIELCTLTIVFWAGSAQIHPRFIVNLYV